MKQEVDQIMVWKIMQTTSWATTEDAAAMTGVICTADDQVLQPASVFNAHLNDPSASAETFTVLLFSGSRLQVVALGGSLLLRNQWQTLRPRW